MALQNPVAEINAAYNVVMAELRALVENEMPFMFRGQAEEKLNEPGTIHTIVDTIDQALTAAAKVRVAPPLVAKGVRHAKT